METAFKVVRTPRVRFVQAIDACAADGGILASIRDFQDWNGIISVGSTLGTLEEEHFWIGLRAKFEFEDASQATFPTNYEFLDGTDSTFFDVARGDFPWRLNNPLDRLNRQCIVMNPTTVAANINQLRWKNELCSKDLGYVCRRPCRRSLDVDEEIDKILTASVFGVALAILGVALAIVMVALFKTNSVKRRLDNFNN